MLRLTLAAVVNGLASTLFPASSKESSWNKLKT